MDEEEKKKKEYGWRINLFCQRDGIEEEKWRSDTRKSAESGRFSEKRGRRQSIEQRCQILSTEMAGRIAAPIKDLKEGNCHDQVNLFKDKSQGEEL